MAKDFNLAHTALDRRIKIDKSTARFMKGLYESGDFTYADLGKMFGVSVTTARFHCLDKDQQDKIRIKDAAQHKVAYFKKTVDDRKMKSQKAVASTKAYKESLLDCKLENCK